ncbi:MAG: AAA family ATPase [Chloroflexota bacterium]
MAECSRSFLASSGKRCPVLVVMAGAPGSGKSYLARTLSLVLDARLIQTDAVRKELFPEPTYAHQEAAAVYQACHRQIAAALANGERVVFDGTNLREGPRRTLYALADHAGATLLIVVAYASEAVIRERLRMRAAGHDPADHSDADWSVYLRLRGTAEPVLRPHIIANTAVDPLPVIRLLERHLQ